MLVRFYIFINAAKKKRKINFKLKFVPFSETNFARFYTLALKLPKDTGKLEQSNLKHRSFEDRFSARNRNEAMASV